MPKQFENREATKLKDKTVLDPAAEKRIERVADKAADKASETEHHYDKDHGIISK
jgi:hypothetical protein